MAERTAAPACHDGADERRKALGRVYSLLLRLAEEKEAANRGEAGNQTRKAARDSPAQKPDMQDTVYHSRSKPQDSEPSRTHLCRAMEGAPGVADGHLSSEAAGVQE